jgi:hypothetical protein
VRRAGFTSESYSVTRAIAVALALAVLTLTPAFSQISFSQISGQSPKNYSIEFARVVDINTKEFSSFGSFPAINSRGDVAFTAVRYGTAGVFRAHQDQGNVAAIALATKDLVTFSDQIAINSGGVVVFEAATTANSSAIFKGDGIFRILIADSSANGLLRIGVGAPSINAAGIVAFSSVLAQRGSPGAVFKGNGGPLTTVAGTSSTGFTSFGNVAINDAGTIVFPANSADGSRGSSLFQAL